MEKQSWKVDVSRFIEVVADRMYSDPILAGLREIITNSLDARSNGVVNIKIDITSDSIKYSDDGIGIDPKLFAKIYGKIASGSKRRKGARGIFGIGRMALIVLSEKGSLSSAFQGKSYTWEFNKKGWKGPIVDGTIEKGVSLEFQGIQVEDIESLKKWTIKTFAIPLQCNECNIVFNSEILVSVLNLYQDPVSLPDMKIFIREEMDGTLFICQKGILVREEPYTGLSAYVDQNTLDIKTDREGFINNEKYRIFREELRKELSILRPEKSFEKMEVEFIQKLMRGFKKYWTKKIETQMEQNLEIEFPEIGHEIIQPELDAVEQSDTVVEIPSHGNPVEIPFIPESTYPESGQEYEMHQEQSLPRESNEVVCLPRSDEIIEVLEPRIQTIEKKETITIKGAKPVDLGEDYPVIFFESDPFVLIFNTSHPIFKRLVERGKLGSHDLAILFERMFECAYTDKYPFESKEDLKRRWKEVDQKLQDIFK